MYQIQSHIQQFRLPEIVWFQNNIQLPLLQVDKSDRNQILMKLHVHLHCSTEFSVNILPPRTPYVNMSILTDVLNVLSTNATQDMILPAIQTALHPYLFASADTIGPR